MHFIKVFELSQFLQRKTLNFFKDIILVIYLFFQKYINISIVSGKYYYYYKVQRLQISCNYFFGL